MAHPFFRPRTAWTAACVAAACALGGCVVAPTDGYYYGTGPVVTVAPPPVVYVPPPAVGHVWIGGSWDSQRDRRHWEAPRPVHRWRQDTWQQEDGGGRPRGGRWGAWGR